MKKRFTPSDLKEFTYLSWPVISDDGSRIACVSKKAEEESGSFPPCVHIYEKQADGSFAENNTLMISDAEAPFFFKDSSRLTVLWSASGEKQVWLFDLTSGRKQQITSLRHGVEDYRLSPDEKSLVFTATLWPEEVKDGSAFTEMSAEEKAAWQDEMEYTPYVAEDLTYKMDEWYGMRKGEFSHIGVSCIDGTGQRILETAGYEAVTPSFSHDGSRIAFYAYPYKGAFGRQKELFVIGADGSGLTKLTDKKYIYDTHAPVWTADDSKLVTFNFPSYSDYSAVLTPYTVDLANGEMVPQLGEFDESICFGAELFIAGRTENGKNIANAYLSEKDNYLYFLSGSKGHTGIFRVKLTDGEANPIEAFLPGRTDIQSFYLSQAGELVYMQGDFSHPAELYYKSEVSAENGVCLSHANDWLQDYAMPMVEEFFVPTKDGKETLQYYLWHPVDQQEGVLYPAVLDIKGGPETMYAAAYWHEFHALASAGHAVIVPNPRGSVGFSRSYMADIICWKQEIVEDMETFVDDAVAKGFIDPARVGVTGGSYGGYMTNKLMGRSEKFAAAVSQRSLVNPGTSYGTGDMGFISSGEVPEDFKMLDYLEDRIKGNIITYIDHFKIPLLILHAKKDYRCTFEQAEQLFIAMKDRNPEVPVRLVMFPEENHGLTRGGKLHSQIRHLQEMTDWFVKYLGKEA